MKIGVSIGDRVEWFYTRHDAEDWAKENGYVLVPTHNPDHYKV